MKISEINRVQLSYPFNLDAELNFTIKNIFKKRGSC
jgi:hypothetical protein